MKAVSELKNLLKSGEYDGADLMQAWCTMESQQAKIAQLEADKAELVDLLERSNFAFKANLARFNVKCERVMLEAHNANESALQKHKG